MSSNHISGLVIIKSFIIFLHISKSKLITSTPWLSKNSFVPENFLSYPTITFGILN